MINQSREKARNNRSRVRVGQCLGHAPALHGQERFSQALSLRCEKEKPLPTVLSSGPLLHKLPRDEILEDTRQRLFGDFENIQKLSN
ncbi:hypothetical protein MCEMSEM23_01712 [Rhabdaerophilaceae bacterium]